MATKLIKFGQQLHFSSVFQHLPRVINAGNLNSPNISQRVDNSFIRNLSLSNCLREEESDDNNVRDPARDRRVLVPPETSIRYLQSRAYKEAYGDKPVWFYYRRNHKGQIPKITRYSCIKGGFIRTGNPCPICRDEYLVLHYTNVDLLKQFISDISGEILDWRVHCLCRRQIRTLLIEIEKAKDYGTLTFDLPFRPYIYQDYIPKDLHFH